MLAQTSNTVNPLHQIAALGGHPETVPAMNVESLYINRQQLRCSFFTAANRGRDAEVLARQLAIVELAIDYLETADTEAPTAQDWADFSEFGNLTQYPIECEKEFANHAEFFFDHETGTTETVYTYSPEYIEIEVEAIPAPKATTEAIPTNFDMIREYAN